MKGFFKFLLIVLLAVIAVEGFLYLQDQGVFETQQKQEVRVVIPTEAPAPVSREVPVVEYVPARQVYTPIEGCAPSRLYVGDYVYVSYGGGSNGIRSYPDVHPADNITYRAPEGEGMNIIGGPECSWRWILWEVITDTGHKGWTPESDGKEFWLVPVDSPQSVPAAITDDPTLSAAYRDAESVMSDRSLSESQRQEKIRVLQRTYGEEVVTTVLRWVPVYDTDRGTFMSFDSYMRGFASDYGYTSTGSPVEKDPVGAGLSIFFDPSPENITEMMGLDDWLP